MLFADLFWRGNEMTDSGWNIELSDCCAISEVATAGTINPRLPHHTVILRLTHSQVGDLNLEHEGRVSYFVLRPEEAMTLSKALAITARKFDPEN
jgi:hypothetical protein